MRVPLLLSSLVVVSCTAARAEAPPWVEPAPGPRRSAERLPATMPSTMSDTGLDREAANPPFVGDEGLVISHPTEAETARPLPLVARLSIGASAVVVRYKPVGAISWRSLKLIGRDGSFEGQIPCGELREAGVLRYYVIASDSSGAPVAVVGSLKYPLTIELRAATEGPLPALPGQSPPPRCDLRDDLERRP